MGNKQTAVELFFVDMAATPLAATADKFRKAMLNLMLIMLQSAEMRPMEKATTLSGGYFPKTLWDAFTKYTTTEKKFIDALVDWKKSDTEAVSITEEVLSFLEIFHKSSTRSVEAFRDDLPDPQFSERLKEFAELIKSVGKSYDIFVREKYK